MSESGAFVELSGVAKGYGEGVKRVEVLVDLDLELARGEMLAVVGPSGVGKSTLLHLVGLLDRPERGTVRVEGIDVGTLGEDERARLRNRRIGFVFQHHSLLDELDAVDNVAVPLRIAGQGARPARRRAAELLERVGLTDRQHHFPDQLSGGEQQRVAVARALAAGPGLLLADEPTGNLDRASTDEVFELVQELHLLEGLSSIIVTHNEDLARRCSRVFRLKRAGRSVPRSSAPAEAPA
jgi:lipoprotein-releasing system ATP-binding protein